MVNFEKLVCSRISEEAQETYQALRNNDEEENAQHHYINTTFVLEIKPQEKLFESFGEIFKSISDKL